MARESILFYIILENGDKIEITFNTPTLKSPNDKGSFLMLKNKMKKIIQNKPQPALIDMSVEFYV